MIKLLEEFIRKYHHGLGQAKISYEGHKMLTKKSDLLKLNFFHEKTSLGKGKGKIQSELKNYKKFSREDLWKEIQLCRFFFTTL